MRKRAETWSASRIWTMKSRRIAKELRLAVGLMGWVAASVSETARLNVTRAIRSTIDKIAEHEPGWAAYSPERSELLDSAAQSSRSC